MLKLAEQNIIHVQVTVRQDILLLTVWFPIAAGPACAMECCNLYCMVHEHHIDYRLPYQEAIQPTVSNHAFVGS